MDESTISLKVYEGHELVFSRVLRGTLRMGRQESGEPVPFETVNTEYGKKMIIAPSAETTVSRHQVEVRVSDERTLVVTNLSSNVPLAIDDGDFCQPGEKNRELDLPVVLSIGSRSLRFEAYDDPIASSEDLQTLAQPTLAPGQARTNVPVLADLLATNEQLSAEDLTRWLLDTMAVFQSGSDEHDYLAHAVEALAKMIGLDFAAAMMLEDDQWVEIVSSGPERMKPSERLLERVRRDKRTVLHTPADDSISSLFTLQSVVAAPLLDPQGEVIGVLYGDRLLTSDDIAFVSTLETMLVELIATGVSNGVARLEQEQRAMKARVQFEQFFTPKLARELEQNPALLEGREADVTVLFCDIRGFSRISHAVGPEQTVAWINDVLDELSDCVVEHNGVLVDYVGDELMAMWGAPEATNDHADSACSSAKEMIRRVTQVDARWRDKLKLPTEVSIGINSGPAHVGNTGSNRKFKYGPLGNTVNLASRVQGATKMIGCNVIMTRGTLDKLQNPMDTRRLCQVEVINIPEPVELVELAVDADQDWKALAATYEEALEKFEQRDFNGAQFALGQLLNDHPKDGPTMTLLSRAVAALTAGAEPTHPVWKFLGK